jgi:hypothetical protein
MGQADAAAKLAAFQRTASWQHGQLIEKGVGDRDGQQQPECGRGKGLRPTAREPQNLACSPVQKGRTQKPRICRGFYGSLF